VSNTKKASKPAIEFQNEWQILEESVAALGKFLNEDAWIAPCHQHIYWAVKGVIDNTPKLMKAYEDLYEMSQALASGWEEMMKGKTLSGLVLPKC